MKLTLSEEFWYYLDDCLCDAVRFEDNRILSEVFRQMKEPASLQVEEHQTATLAEFLEDIAETETGSIGTEAAMLANKLTD